MGMQIGDDGSTLTTDAYGNVVDVTDNQGNKVAPAGAAGLIAQVEQLINYGVRSVIDTRYRNAAAAQAAAAAPPPLQLGPIVLLAGAALVAYVVLAK